MSEQLREALRRLDAPMDWDRDDPADRYRRFEADVRAALAEPAPDSLDAAWKQAAAQERERIAREIEGLPVNDDITWADDQPIEAFVNRAAVLAIVRGEA